MYEYLVKCQTTTSQFNKHNTTADLYRFNI